MGDIAIKTDKLRKTYMSYKTNVQKMQNLLFGKDVGEKNVILRGISLEIKRGEKVGIIARTMIPGSSLIRIIAGVIQPTAGKVKVDGKVTAILDNRLGFDSILSGRENYEIRCKLEGWPKEMISEREEQIFEFAGLAKEIENPLKTYKRMNINRLGFAIATELKPEILLYDENLSFGGVKINNKCIRHLKKLIEGDDVTFVMNVADRKAGAKLCERGIVLNRGKIAFDGTYEEAVAYYEENFGIVKSANNNEPSVPKEKELGLGDNFDSFDDMDGMDGM